MSVGLGTQIALSAALGLSLVFGGCGSSPAPEDDSTNGPSIPVVGNYPAAGGAGQGPANTSSSNGFKGWRSDAAGSSGAAGTATAAGSSGAAGHPAAGSSGSAGMSSAAGASGSAGSDAAAGSDATMDDPLDIFGLGGGAAPSCDGQICVEDKDCADLHPEETAACKFTKCVDFACAK